MTTVPRPIIEVEVVQGLRLAGRTWKLTLTRCPALYEGEVWMAQLIGNAVLTSQAVMSPVVTEDTGPMYRLGWSQIMARLFAELYPGCVR